jgi:hypothetical protein
VPSPPFLENKLYGRAGTKQGVQRHAEPDWAMIHRELTRKHITLSILWEECTARHPTGGAAASTRAMPAERLGQSNDAEGGSSARQSGFSATSCCNIYGA